MKAWLRKYRNSILVGITFGLAPAAARVLSPVELGVLFVLLCIGYITWLCSRRDTPSRQ